MSPSHGFQHRHSTWNTNRCTPPSVRGELEKKGAIATIDGSVQNPQTILEERHRKSEINHSCHENFRDDIVALLKAYAKHKDLENGRKLHADILQQKLLEKDLYLRNALINLYAKCGTLATAQQVFEEFQYRDVVSWNALISGYAQNGYGEEALKCFQRMQKEGCSPNPVTFVCLLKACSNIRAAEKGREIHAVVVTEGLLKNNVIVGTALVDMYAKCGALGKAQESFNSLPVRSIISWNALIAGYVQYGYVKEALESFDQMQQKGFSPNSVTFLCILKACGSMRAIEKGTQIYGTILREGLLERNVLIGTALMDMYAKCGTPSKAQEVFDQLHIRDIASWNTLIAAYVQHGYGEEALNCFEQIQHEGLSPDAISVVYALKACASTGAVDKGKEIHSDTITNKFLEKDVMVGSALIDMYAKCGSLAKAQDVFDQLQFRDLVSWNVLLAGYAQLGKDCTILDLFNKMIGEGMVPDSITFTVVLNACSHSGLVDKGQMYFETIIMNHGIVPSLEHYTCMIDLFCRAGQFDKAIVMIKEMPFCADVAVWHAMLGSCQQRGNIEFGKLAFESVLKLGEKDAAAYICMSNIYAAAGMQEDANKLERVRKDALVNY